MGNMEQRGSDQPAFAGSFRADFEIAKARSMERGSPVSLLSQPLQCLNLWCVCVCRVPPGAAASDLDQPSPSLPLDPGVGGEEGVEKVAWFFSPPFFSPGVPPPTSPLTPVIICREVPPLPMEVGEVAGGGLPCICNTFCRCSCAFPGRSRRGGFPGSWREERSPAPSHAHLLPGP